MTKFIDITLQINQDIVTWPDMPEPEIKRLKDLSKGDEVTNSWLGIDVHCGTHIDSPAHHLENGDFVEDYSLDSFVGEAYIINVKENVINKEIVNRYKEVFQKYDKILIKSNSSLDLANGNFNKNYTALNRSGAEEVIKYDIDLLGIDYLSIQKFGRKHNNVHKILLKEKIALLEGLNLDKVSEGKYKLYAFPLKVKEVEGIPARAVLETDK